MEVNFKRPEAGRAGRGSAKFFSSTPYFFALVLPCSGNEASSVPYPGPSVSISSFFLFPDSTIGTSCLCSQGQGNIEAKWLTSAQEVFLRVLQKEEAVQLVGTELPKYPKYLNTNTVLIATGMNQIDLVMIP